jgi:hypothetical protein
LPRRLLLSNFARVPKSAAPIRLTAQLYRLARVRFVNVPRPVVRRLGTGRHVPALLRFHGARARVTLAVTKQGHYRFAIKVRLLHAAGVDADDTIRFSLARDPVPREPELPEELRRAFRTQPLLAQRWAAQNRALREEVLRYLFESDSPETLAQRCGIFLDRLATTGRLRTD